MLKKIKLITILFITISFFFIISTDNASCSREPQNKKDVCKIFKELKKWYKSADRSEQKWHVPKSILMAIIFYESGYRPKAKPPRTTCLYFFPGPRPSSAYGYAQAIDSTWDNYKIKTGNTRAKRDKFDDAIDFVGWYCNYIHNICKISKNDAYRLYLAYHEGEVGYKNKSYSKKKWLIKRAKSVQKLANIYSSQLMQCEAELKRKKGWFCLWPF